MSLSRGGIALAFCGEGGQAQSVVDELTKRYPLNTLIKDIWLPVIGAAMALQRNAAAEAIQMLEAARRYEGAAEFWPSYLRGQRTSARRRAEKRPRNFGRSSTTGVRRRFRRCIRSRSLAWPARPRSQATPPAPVRPIRTSSRSGRMRMPTSLRQEAQHEYAKLD